MSDDWHSFPNFPPRPEDFLPTGWIHAITENDDHHRLTREELKDWLSIDTVYTYWRRITPPDGRTKRDFPLGGDVDLDEPYKEYCKNENDPGFNVNP